MTNNNHKSFIETIKQERKEEAKKLVLEQDKLQEIHNRIESIKDNIAAYDKILHLQLKKQSNGNAYQGQKQEEVSNYSENELEDHWTEEDDLEDEKFDDPAHQNNLSASSEPMDMLYPQFKNMSLQEIVSSILEESDAPMTIPQVTSKAYDTETKEQFNRAKGSIGATLRIGVDKKLWLKIDRGVFAKNIFYDTSSSPESDSFRPSRIFFENDRIDEAN